MRHGRRVSALIAGSVAAFLALPAGSASAAVTCQKNGADMEVTITGGAASTLVRSGNEIQVKAGGGGVVACTNGPVLNNNINNVIFFEQTPAGTNTSSTIDLTGGQFEPGLSGEAGTDEIEISYQGMEVVEIKGTTGVDNIRFGTSGANINLGDEGLFNFDADVFGLDAVSGLERADVRAGDSADFAGGQGSAGTGSPFPLPLILIGEAGGDQLTGGDADDRVGFSGEPGDDTLKGGAGIDQFDAAAGNDTIDGGTGNDMALYNSSAAPVTLDLSITGQQVTGGGGNDTLTGVEMLFGSFFNDDLRGDAGANVLNGFSGSDLIAGRAGSDTLLGDDPITPDPGGNDAIFARDGTLDTVECFLGNDSVVSDQAGVDTIGSGCESIDFAPFDPVNDPSGGEPGASGGSDVAVDASLAAKRRQHVLDRHGLTAKAGCAGEGCDATLRGSIALGWTKGSRSATRAKALRLKPVTATLPAGSMTRLKLRLSASVARKLAAALEDGPLSGKITLEVTDAAGNHDSATARVKVVD